MKANYYERTRYFVFSNDFWACFVFVIVLFIVTGTFYVKISKVFEKSWKQLFLNINKMRIRLAHYIQKDNIISQEDFINDQYDENFYFLKTIMATYNRYKSDKVEAVEFIKKIDVRKVRRERVFLKNFNDNVQSLYYKV